MNEITVSMTIKLVEDGNKVSFDTNFEPSIPGPKSEEYKNMNQQQKLIVGLASEMVGAMLDKLGSMDGAKKVNENVEQ